MKQSDLWNERFAKPMVLPNADHPWVANYMDVFNTQREKPILDLGCGRGENAIYLHRNGFRVIACDFSENALSSLRNICPGIRNQCFDMTAGIPISPQSVGVVLSSLSTHYFSLADTVKVYRDIHTVLCDGGHFIFRVNSLKEYEINDKDDAVQVLEQDYYILRDGSVKRYFSIDSIRALLKGFEIDTMLEVDFVYHKNRKYAIEGVARKN